MKIAFTTFFLVVFLSVGCARVKVEVPKEPIKVDISMRLDIYQHIIKDIDSIENIVSGAESKSNTQDRQSVLPSFICFAYAEASLSQQVEKAALRRKERRPELIAWQEKGVIGENRFGLVEVRNKEYLTEQVTKLVEEENKDRLIIYQELAIKNNVSVESIQKIYAERLQADAVAGTPVEITLDSGKSVWKIK